MRNCLKNSGKYCWYLIFSAYEVNMNNPVPSLQSGQLGRLLRPLPKHTGVIINDRICGTGTAKFPKCARVETKTVFSFSRKAKMK
jgi:hypothetical protein